LTDNLSTATRSKIMASIRSKNTRPELAIRKLLWIKGKRYRVHDRSIIGRPDISSKKAKLAVFIDGCFWHGCSCSNEPSTNASFWKSKISTNKRRRTTVRQKLSDQGWRVLEFWEHEIRADASGIAEKIAAMMPSPRA
jgi:DNA mismatch endonuclease (patch repair protein)